MVRRILKILADPILQFFCLTHIDDLVGFILHDIHAWGIGKAQRLDLQLFKGHTHTSKRTASMPVMH